MLTPTSIITPGARLELLNVTIQHAVKTTRYYSEMFTGLKTEVASWDDFHRFPILHREVLLSRWSEFLAQGEVPVAVGMTGGSTHKPLLLWKAREETETKEFIYSALRSQTDVRPLLMHLVNLAHGLDPGAAREGCFQMPLERPHHFESIIQLLRHSFVFAGYSTRVRAIAGPLRLLKALTMLCLEQGIKGTEFAVEIVSSSSDQLTLRWKSLLESFWAAPVVETYGLSEVPGLHAHRCEGCSHFHFSPLAVIEILSLHADEPASSSIGRLIATSLYPLAVMQPIIRYDTGDVIEYVGECQASGAMGFEFLGRIAQVATVPTSDGTELLIAPRFVNEVLDCLPDVARRQLNFARPLGLSENIGFPEWSLSSSSSDKEICVNLAVELRWSPHQFPDAARHIQQSVISRLKAAAPALAEGIRTGKVNFRFNLMGPGAISLRTTE